MQSIQWRDEARTGQKSSDYKPHKGKPVSAGTRATSYYTESLAVCVSKSVRGETLSLADVSCEVAEKDNMSVCNYV